MIDINDLTLGQVGILKDFFGKNQDSEDVKVNPFEVGEKYFIRTVTHAHTGKVKSIAGQFITLESAAWIADTGRFYDALKNTEFSEIEPFSNDLILNMDSIIDATLIDGELPRKQK